MTKPMPLSDFTRLPRAIQGAVVDGLAAAIDTVADAGPASHRFLRYQWFAAAVAAYGGHPRTLIVTAEDRPVLAMPLIATGPRRLGLASVPGCYWPFRSFALAGDAGEDVIGEALAVLARGFNAVRIGPVYDDDASTAPLLAAARARGWAVIDRFVAQSYLLDMNAAQAEGAWPRGSTLRKNRFHEKHLAEHGALDWGFASGDDWPAGFDDLAAIEARSWIAERTDGRDAKFTQSGHGAFWRAASSDRVLAAMMRAAVLRVGGVPAAFSFDLDAGDLKYAIANSYDPTFAKHSPGRLLYYRNLVDALARGVTRVDWGAGDSGYKRTIGAEPGPAIRDWLLLRPGLPAFAGKMLARMWRRSGN